MAFPVPDLSPLADISEDDILEMVMGDLSPRQDSMAYDRADCTLTYRVPYTKLTGFLMWMLGVDYVDANNALRRTCPAFHPVYPWLWCDTVQINGQGFRGDDSGIVQYQFQNTPAKWDSIVATCSFSMPNYNIAYDWDTTDETTRFLSKEFQPNAELVSLDIGGMFIYDSGATATNIATKPCIVPQPIGRRETTGIKLIWHRVPFAFIQADDNSMPTKFLQMMGRVNDATFLGMPPETVLCKAINLRKYVSPLISNTVGQLYFLCDVQFDLVYYDPEKKGFVNTTSNGWNYQIASDRRYYHVTNSITGRPVFESFTYAKAFTFYTDTWTPP